MPLIHARFQFSSRLVSISVHFAFAFDLVQSISYYPHPGALICVHHVVSPAPRKLSKSATSGKHCSYSRACLAINTGSLQCDAHAYDVLQPGFRHRLVLYAYFRVRSVDVTVTSLYTSPISHTFDTMSILLPLYIYPWSGAWDPIYWM
jgi:hypothetical protein